MARKITIYLSEKTYQKIQKIPYSHRSETIRKLIDTSELEDIPETRRGRPRKEQERPHSILEGIDFDKMTKERLEEERKQFGEKEEEKRKFKWKFWNESDDAYWPFL